MKEAYEILFSQTEAKLADIVWSEYNDVLFISKNIGTIIATSFATKYELKHAIGIMGIAYPWSGTDEIIRISNANHIPLTVYDGCDHSLECNDILKNIETLRNVIQKTMNFLKLLNLSCS